MRITINIGIHQGFFCLLLVGLLAAPTWAQLGPCTIETVAGSWFRPELNEGPAVETAFFNPDSARLGPDGAVYITDTSNNVIRRVTPDGQISTVAGTGEPGFSGDGGPATQAKLSEPIALAFGPDGSYYFIANLRVRRVTPEGTISTVAGNGESRNAVDGSLATETGIRFASNITLDGDGNLYIVSANAQRIWKVTTEGVIRRLTGSDDPVRGSGGLSGDGGPAQEAEVHNPSDVAADSAGNVYIADRNNDRIRRIKPDGTIETFIGNDGPGSNQDGTHRTEAVLRSVSRIEIDGDGRLYWSWNGNIQSLDAEERIETVYDSTDLAVFRFFVSPSGVFHTVGNGQVRRLSLPSGHEHVAGVGPPTLFADGGSATEALIGRPARLALGPHGDIYVLDVDSRRVLRFTPGGAMERVAGTGEFGDSGDGGPARDATFQRPLDIAVDTSGNLYIADISANRVRRVDAGGIITNFAGSGSTRCTNASCGDGRPALEADLPQPAGVEVDSQNNVYIRHGRMVNRSSWIRWVDSEGIIHRLSEEGIAEEYEFSSASRFSITARDRILLSFGIFGAPYYQADIGEPFEPLPGSQGFTSNPALGFTADENGNVYFSDRSDSIERLTSEGILNTIVGGDGIGFAGDGGPASDAQVFGPTEFLLLDGDLYFSDSRNRRVRRINDVGACPVVVRPQIAGGARNAASFGSGLAPGTIFTLFGVRLGPAEGVGARIGPGGRLTTELGGTRVLVDGIPAAMVFSSNTQVNAIVPYGIEFGGAFSQSGGFVADRFVPIQVEFDGGVSELSGFIPVPYIPALFTLDGSGSGQAAALNQDGTVNGPLNPAVVGSVIVLFATGEGQTDPPGIDGKIAVDTLPKPLVEVKVLIEGQPAQVLYAGAAPNLTAGVIQVNAVIPPDLAKRGPVSVQLVMGSIESTRFGPVIIVGE